MTRPDWQAVRREFPVLTGWVYLDSATFGPVPRRAVEAIVERFELRDRSACQDFIGWFDEAGAVREKAGHWIGASADDIAFIPSAGAALSWILHAVDWKLGDQILGLEDDFPNNIYAPRALGYKGVEFVAAPAGEQFDLEEFLKRIGPRTKLVLISAVNYSTGLRPPLDEIGRKCRETGSLFIVDGTQGVGAIPLNVRQTHADALIVHGYKWMLTPPGIGFLYVHEDARRRLAPSIVSWRSHRAWRDVDHLHHGEPEVPSSAAKYEGGMLNFSGIDALGASLDLFEQIGAEAVFRRVEENAKAIRRSLVKAGGEPYPPNLRWFDSPIITARFAGRDVSRLATGLREKRIAVAARRGSLRVSPHFFNNESDAAALEAALLELRDA